VHDVLVIGAGPVGLACAIEAQRHGLSARLIEKGALVNSIVGYPVNMEFFSTPELIEIGRYPFPVQGYKPTREEAIEYYRGVAAREALDLCLYERVLAVEGSSGEFTVLTDRGRHAGRKVIVVTGFFDRPNFLKVPGEDLPKVTHYYREPYQYVRQRVAVIGAKNSAAKAALDCYRHGASVTLIVRTPALSDSIKYWIRPDLENRIKEGSIRALFNTVVEEIRPASLLLRTGANRFEVENDWVLAIRSAKACISREPSAAAIGRTAGSSRTAASTRSRSPSTSPASTRNGSGSRRSTGKPRSSKSRPQRRGSTQRNRSTQPRGRS